MNKPNKLVTYDYEGAAITFQQGEAVMVNATEMARHFGKRVNDFLSLPSTKEYIAALEKTTEKSGSLTTGFSISLITTKEGRNGGTWMHKTLAIEFARWLSPEFSIWCNQKIEELLRTGEVSIRKKIPTKNRVDATMAWITGVSEMFNLDAASQQRMVNKFAEDYDLPLLDYTPTNGGRDSLTNLLNKHGLAISTQKANKALADAGYLVSREVKKKNGRISRYYEVTESGKVFGDNFQSEHNPKETQPLWYVNKFAELIPVFKSM